MPRPLRLFFQLVYPFQEYVGELFGNNLVYLPFTVGYRVIPYVGKFGFGANNFFYFINVFDVYKVYAAANVCYFNKDRIHGVKVVI